MDAFEEKPSSTTRMQELGQRVETKVMLTISHSLDLH